MLIHRHRPAECRVVSAAWRAYESPLRGQMVQSTCSRHMPGPTGDGSGASDLHEFWCTVEAQDAASALAQLPPFIADRTEVREVTKVKVG